MDNPCSICADYPYWCSGICRDKAKYIAEVDEDTHVVRKIDRYRKNSKKTNIDTNKNGIRREIRR